MLSALFKGLGLTGHSQQTKVSNERSRQHKMPTRQQLAIDAQHIQRIRRTPAHVPTGIIRSKKQRKHHAPQIETHKPHEDLDIVRQCSTTWRTQDYVRSLATPSPSPDVEPVLVSGSDTGGTLPASSQRSSSVSSHTSKTDITSIFEEDGDSIGSCLDIAEALIQKDAEIAAFREQVIDAQRQQRETYTQYQDLLASHKIQLDQRRLDKEKVDDAFQRYTGLAKRSRKLEESTTAQLDAKSRELAKLERDQRHTILELETAYQEELNDRIADIDCLRAQLVAKVRELIKAKEEHRSTANVTAEALEHEMRSKDGKIQELEAVMTLKDEAIKQAKVATDEMRGEMRNVTRASEINRRAWEEEKDDIVQRVWQFENDHQDSFQATKDEVIRLTSNKRSIEMENQAMWYALQRNITDYPSLQEVVLESMAARKDIDDMRRKNTILTEKVENTLEAMQQERDHWNSQHQKEKVAQGQVRQLRIDVADLEERLAQRDERIHDLGEELCTKGAHSGVDCGRLGALERAVADIDDLQARVRTLQEEKVEVQREANKVDDEALKVAMEIGTKDAELHTLRINNSAIIQAHKVSEQEFEYLRCAVQGCKGGLSPEERVSLASHLRDLTAKIQQMSGEMSSMMTELEELRTHKHLIEDKAQHNVDRAKTEANFYLNAYYDFAVNKVENLQAELGKKAGTLPSGPRGRPERNPVDADRAALRAACEVGTMRGISSSRIPPEYNEPGFRPGRIAATMDALRVLRPMGWEAVNALEKVWLQPLYTPFTEEDAAAHLDDRELQILQEAIAFKDMDAAKPGAPQVVKARTRALLPPSGFEAPRAPHRMKHVLRSMGT